VWHSVLYKDFGEKLVSVSCRVKFNLSKFTNHSGIVRLDIYR
jgi:hypothetical protein